MSGLSPLLERPDIYNGLYLLGKRASPFIEQEEPVGTQSSTSQMTSLVGNVYIIFSRKPENGF